MYSLILFGLVASVSANVYHNAQCPLVKPVENFNLEAYGNGVWFEIARLPNDAEKGAQCGSTEYSLQGDTIQIKSYHVANGRLASIDGSARLALPSTSQGKMIFTLPYGVAGAKNEYIGWILDTDYVNYAIVYHCKYNAEKKVRQDFAWILSRSKTLDASTKAKIDKFIGECTFLDSSKFIYNDFSESACRVQSSITMFAFVFLTIVAAAIASDVHVHVDSGCPDVKPVEDFNLAAFARGKWYELARYPNSIEDGANCGWADYVLSGDVFSVKNFDISKGKLRTIEGSACLAEDAGKTGKLTFSYPYGVAGATTKNTLWVLGTDYDNYAVVYYCKYNEEKKTRQDFNWVFSRQHSFTDSTRAAVDKILKDTSFLDSSKLIWPDFSDEACTHDEAKQ
ncbi:uncharacterized protein LOC123875309 [Maniola jurtina]|uniref:uncharacterized protein LOC123875309 n=1 Tax=Maniola jurtina TaxID=191418 RepID=UPI001E68982E|nr:uncharacterized protein LOC123875309 [Maniola jurtina]